MKYHKNILLISSAVIFLGGCVSVLPEAPKLSDKLVLDVASRDSSKKLATHNVLAVSQPRCSDFRDTTRIVVFHEKTGAVIQDYLVGTEWSDRLPLSFQSVLVQTLSNSNMFRGVIYQSESIDADLLLMTDIRRFDVVVQPMGSQELVLEITGNLLKTTGRQLISQRTFSKKEALAEKNLKGLQESYNAALTHLLQDISQWVQEKI